MIRGLVITLFLLFNHSVWSQYPSYFNTTIENGCPSNEIYSLLEDSKGYIWIGSDAGIYRFNGTNFEHFSSQKQTARSVTGLCESASGVIYAYNFNGQILRIKNNRLTIIPQWKKGVNQLTPGINGQIWMSTESGIFVLDEATLKISKASILDQKGINNSIYANNVRFLKNGTICYTVGGEIIFLKGSKVHRFPLTPKAPKTPIFISNSTEKPWAFTQTKGQVFCDMNGNYLELPIGQLQALLKTRKITNVIDLNDGWLWITTHTGIIRCNKTTKKCELLFPEIAFSACHKDKTGTYWLGTLHNGLFRIPNLSIRVWNKQHSSLENEQFTHLVCQPNKIIGATTNGNLVAFEKGTFNSYFDGLQSDLGAMYSDPVDGCVYYNKLNNIYRFDGKKTTLLTSNARPIKDFLRINNDYIVATSQGTYRYSLPKDRWKEMQCITPFWSRQLLLSPFSKGLFIATNQGLIQCTNTSNYRISRTYLAEKQITSITSSNQMVYLVTFDGVVYALNANGQLKKVYTFQENYRIAQLQYRNGQLFFASNLGLLKLDLQSYKLTCFDRYCGLTSNNVSTLLFDQKSCWIATGKGIHYAPIDQLKTPTIQSRLYLKKLEINNKSVRLDALKDLHFSDRIRLKLDGLCYSANGKISYSYRFNSDQSDWNTIPGESGELILHRLPIGVSQLEIRLLDQYGEKTDAVIRLNLVVAAPYWQRWWFYLGIGGLIGILSYFIFRIRLQKINKKQQQKLRQLELENELRLTQQNALKAQMNPHFLFNVLNSIKGFIYENDKKNAAKYLSDFSLLVRKVLDMSSVPKVSLKEELAVLEVYIQLEAMLLEDNFSYSIELQEGILDKELEIPSLLIQPYVENAFKHGLRHQQGHKQLQIVVTYQEEKETLCIHIIDNGIGRKASHELNLQTRSNHQSFATNALSKRIELLNAEQENFISVAVHDQLIDNQVTGTKVILQLLIQNK